MKCPYFAPGGICLCLALLGVERCLDDGKWGLLTLSALLSLLTNFYHGYSTLVMAAVYALARLAYRAPGRGLKRVVREGLMLLGAALCGVLLSGFMLAPLLKAFMACARSGGASGYGESLLHWPWSYYRQLVADFFAPYGQARNWTQLSFLPWTAAGVAALFALGKGPRWARWLRAGLLLAVAGLCVPLAGRLFNGMSYAANRWSYGVAFVCCLAASAGLPALLDAGFARRRAVAAAMLAWAALMGIVALRGVDGAFMDMKLLGLRLSAWVVLFGAALLVCAAAWVLAWDARLRAGRTDARRAERFGSVTLALCCLAYTGGYGAAMLARFPRGHRRQLRFVCRDAGLPRRRLLLQHCARDGFRLLHRPAGADAALGVPAAGPGRGPLHERRRLGGPGRAPGEGRGGAALRL